MSRVEVIGKVVDRPLIGEPDQVAAALESLRARGDLVAAGGELPLVDGRVAVPIRFVDRTPEPRSYRVAWIAGGTVAAAGTVTVAGWLAAEWVAAHLAVVLGVLVVLIAVAWFVLGRVGACPGVHCPGCRHH